MRPIGPSVSVAGRRVPGFQLWGLVGLGAAVSLSALVVEQRGLSLGVMATIDVVAVLTFLALALLTKVATGVERLTYYHHEIAVIVVTAIGLHLAGRPVAAYLDPTVLGVGAFLVFGRIGCFTAGCCHGRPARRGVRYGPAHAAEGFPRYLVGVPLAPVPLLEAGWVALVVAAATVACLRGSAEGVAFAGYVVAYDAGRYGLEFLRGDPDRPYRAGFSANQWVSLGLSSLLAVAELAGRLPFVTWHLAVTGGLVAVTAGLAIVRLLDPDHRAKALATPAHLQELARAIDRCAARPELSIERTSLGVRLSVATAEHDGTPVRAITVSADGGLAEAAVATLERALQLVTRAPTTRLTPTATGSWHFLTSGGVRSSRIPVPTSV